MARMNDAMHDLLRYNSAMLPKKRSTFNRSASKATTFDSAYLVPILCEPILPGDEVELTLDALVRMATPLHPTMDTAYVDFWAFYCPDRIVWDNAKAFYGENLDAEYNTLGEYKIPSFKYGDSVDSIVPWKVGSLLDYMELPKIEGERNTSPEVSVLPFRMYQKIWNDWFRASEIQPSVNINYGDIVDSSEVNNGVFEMRKVCKMHDYFTSLLPRPQGGDSVTLPLGDTAPVVTGNLITARQNLNPLMLNAYLVEDGVASFGGNNYFLGNHIEDPYGVASSLEIGDVDEPYHYFSPANLYTDLSSASAATVNALRAAITVQQALEIDSAGGTRYSSLIRSHFGIITPDDVLQRPQLLGTARQVVGMRQIAQTSATSINSIGGSNVQENLGDLGAYSATRIGNEKIVSKGFTEFGYLFIFCAVRPLHTYSQGVPEHFRKLSRFDHYYPVFDNIGNQPVYTESIYCDGSGNNNILGYKSAWAEYRIKNNAVTGLMRPDVNGSLATWNYADYYGEAPILNSDFLTEDEELIDRTIVMQNQPQFIGDFYFDLIHTRPMGVDSIPGLKRL